MPETIDATAPKTELLIKLGCGIDANDAKAALVREVVDKGVVFETDEMASAFRLIEGLFDGTAGSPAAKRWIKITIEFRCCKITIEI